MELNSVKKVIVVTVAAMISLTGSARNTANTLLSKKFGRIKIRGISRTILRRQASSRLTFAPVEAGVMVPLAALGKFVTHEQ